MNLLIVRYKSISYIRKLPHTQQQKAEWQNSTKEYLVPAVHKLKTNKILEIQWLKILACLINLAACIKDHKSH